MLIRNESLFSAYQQTNFNRCTKLLDNLIQLFCQDKKWFGRLRSDHRRPDLIVVIVNV